MVDRILSNYDGCRHLLSKNALFALEGKVFCAAFKAAICPAPNMPICVLDIALIWVAVRAAIFCVVIA